MSKFTDINDKITLIDQGLTEIHSDIQGLIAQIQGLAGGMSAAEAQAVLDSLTAIGSKVSSIASEA